MQSDWKKSITIDRDTDLSILYMQFWPPKRIAYAEYGHIWLQPASIDFIVVHFIYIYIYLLISLFSVSGMLHTELGRIEGWVVGVY